MRRLPTTLLLLVAGLIFLLGWLPGDLAAGPRIGMGVLFVMLGLLVFTLANVEWFLRRTTRPEDYEGKCPVGEACEACEAFNLKPRRTCRSCGGPVNQASEAL